MNAEAVRNLDAELWTLYHKIESFLSKVDFILGKDQCYQESFLPPEDTNDFLSYANILDTYGKLEYNKSDDLELSIPYILSTFEELLRRMICLSQLLDDLEEQKSKDKQDNLKIFALISGIAIMAEKTQEVLDDGYHDLEKLDDLVEQKEYEEEEVIPLLTDRIEFMVTITEKIFDAYILQHPVEAIEEDLEYYKQTILDSLRQFVNGEDLKAYSYSLSVRTNEELLVLDYSPDGDSMQVSEYGSVYHDDIGSDTYPLWEYTLFRSGDEEGELRLNLAKYLEMINMGAELCVTDCE